MPPALTTYGETFTARGGAYERAMATCPDARDQEFRTLVGHVQPQPGEVIVDTPSGGGYLRRHLPDFVQYLGIDEAPDFQRACATRVQTHDRVLAASGSDLPLPDAACDAACSLAGMHHVPQRAAHYAEVFRILRPGGRLVLADVEVGSAPALFLNGFVDAHLSQGHCGHFFTEQETDVLDDAGFTAVRTWLETYVWVFSDEAEATAFCLALFGLDHPEAAQRLPEVLRGDLGLHAAADGSWHLPWGLRYCSGRKSL